MNWGPQPLDSVHTNINRGAILKNILFIKKNFFLLKKCGRTVDIVEKQREKSICLFIKLLFVWSRVSYWKSPLVTDEQENELTGMISKIFSLSIFSNICSVYSRIKMFLLLFTFFTSPASASNLLSSFCFKVSIVRLRPSASIVPALVQDVSTQHL